VRAVVMQNNSEDATNQGIRPEVVMKAEAAGFVQPQGIITVDELRHIVIRPALAPGVLQPRR